MSELLNPFTPNFGQVPIIMAGRNDILTEVKKALDRGSNDPSLTSIFVGSRGSGKTALLTYLAEYASSNGWIAANVSCEPGMLEDILERTQEAGAHLIAGNTKTRISGIQVGSTFGIELSAEASQGNWRTQMNRLLDQLQEHNTGLLITIDEVLPTEKEMVQLASVYQHFVREGRKVALFMAGLPGNISSLLNNKSISFLRRAAQYHLGRIPDADIESALIKSVEAGGRSIQLSALDKAVVAAEGFPYMLQLVGFRAWDQHPAAPEITNKDVEWAVSLAKRDLETRVFNATYFELSDGDLRFLQTMLQDENSSKTADIATRLNESSGFVSVYKTRLLELGIIGEVRRGEIRFELPGFRDYLQNKLK